MDHAIVSWRRTLRVSRSTRARQRPLPTRADGDERARGEAARHADAHGRGRREARAEGRLHDRTGPQSAAHRAELQLQLRPPRFDHLRAPMKWLSKEDAIRASQTDTGRGCIACELARDADPILASERAVAVLDRYACRPGHILVVLRRHAENIAALDWDEYAELQRLTWHVAGALDRVLAPRRIYIASLGSAEPLAV